MLKLVRALDTKIINVEDYCSEFSDSEDLNCTSLWNLKLGERNKYIYDIIKPWQLFYYLVDDENPDYIIGYCKVALLYEKFDVGNISYGIRPSERKKGYGTKILDLLLRECEDMGLNEVFVSCYADNIASRKVIKNNNGKFIKEFTDESQNITYKYSMILSPKIRSQLVLRFKINRMIKQLTK